MLFHDGTNARLEKLLTDVAKNSLSYELSLNLLLRAGYQDLLRAIRGRVDMIRALDISSSALTAQRDAAGRDCRQHRQRRGHAPGGRHADPVPPAFRDVHDGDGQGGPGVHVDAVRADPSPLRKKYDPGHMDADAQGYVQLPNVSITMEYVDALAASRAYEANAAMLNVTRSDDPAGDRLLA